MPGLALGAGTPVYCTYITYLWSKTMEIWDATFTVLEGGLELRIDKLGHVSLMLDVPIFNCMLIDRLKWEVAVIQSTVVNPAHFNPAPFAYRHG